MFKKIHTLTSTPLAISRKPKDSTKKVIVLLSTYNGEKYIKDQLDSILAQTYRNVEIYVRDDGSHDNTVEILRQYEKNGKVSLICGDNIGFIDSFFWLISNVTKADYYSFADQDDIWLEDKLIYAVNALNSGNSTEPQLYFSNYDYHDEHMNFIGHNNNFLKQPRLIRTLTGGECAMGFSTVINYRLKEIVKENLPETKDLYGHDFWFYLVALATGQVIYDRQVTAKYRRHSMNVSSAINMSFIRHQVWRIKSFLIKNDAKKISKSIKMCNDKYYIEMNSQTKHLFRLFGYEKYHLITALHKAFYLVRYRDSAFDEIALRLIYLIGKM